MAWFAVLVGNGCATHDWSERRARPSVKPGEFGESGCFFARQAQNFQALDDRNLIVLAPSESQAYHLQISPPAFGLRFANGLAFVSNKIQLCGYPGDALLLDEGGGQRRFSITGVWRLNEDSLQALRARFGHGDAPKPIAPAPPEGASVERELDSKAGQR
jgi:hypothetical protein